MNAKFWLVIPAAGVGSRMGASKPKQYLTVLEKTLIEWSLERVWSAFAQSSTVIALAQDDQWWPSLSQSVRSKVQVCVGGNHRAASVANALQSCLALGASAQDWVVVHDAVRPCVTNEELASLIQFAATADDAALGADRSKQMVPVGAALGLPLVDSITQVNDVYEIAKPVSRENIWKVLTPQISRLGALAHALEQTGFQGMQVTDESQALASMGYRVKMLFGSDRNCKVTRPGDLPLIETFLRQQTQECGEAV